MKKLVIIAFMFMALIFSGRLTSQNLQVKFSQNSNYEGDNDSVFNTDGYYCNTDLIAFHDFSTGSNITKWVWVFSESAYSDTVVMLLSCNYWMHIAVFYPNTVGSYNVSLTVFALDSVGVEYSKSVTITIHLGFAELVVGNPYPEINYNDSLVLKVHGNSGAGNFVWRQGNTELCQTINTDSSQLTIYQPGIYTVKYTSPSGCEIENDIYVDLAFPSGTFCAQFAVNDSANLGGDWVCNQDSITIIDMCHLCTTGEIYHWRYQIKTADDQTVLQQFDFDQANYQPSFVVYLPDSNAAYRIELAISSYIGIMCTSNSGTHLGFAHAWANNNSPTLIPGDTLTLSVMAASIGGFEWSKNGSSIIYNGSTISSQLLVSDTGTYLVHYWAYGASCDDYLTIIVTYAPAVAPVPPVAKISLNGDTTYSNGLYLCNANIVTVGNFSTGTNITKTEILVQTANGIDITTFVTPNALSSLSVTWPYGVDAVYTIELRVYSFDSANNIESMDSVSVQIHLGFADILIDEQFVLLVPGSSVTLNAHTNVGPGNFSWSKFNGSILATDSNATMSHFQVSDTGTYIVQYYNNAFTCGAGIGIYVTYDISASISEPENTSDFKIYPNPATSQFTVNAPDSKVEIFSTTGQLLYSSLSGNQPLQVNSSNWAPGFYFVKLTTKNGQTKTTKLVKQ